MGKNSPHRAALRALDQPCMWADVPILCLKNRLTNFITVF